MLKHDVVVKLALAGRARDELCSFGARALDVSEACGTPLRLAREQLVHVGHSERTLRLMADAHDRVDQKVTRGRRQHARR